MSAAVVFLLFFICLIIAIPISIALGIVSVLPGAFDPSFTASGTFVIRSMLGGIDSFPLLAVPMFVLSGMIMAKGGISKKIFDVFAFFIGKLTAGMPCAVIVTCLFYGAISGSAPATVAAVGSMTIPILVRLGYDKSFTTAIVAVAGGLGVIIPPSIPFIMYGMASGESVSDLFMAGVVPGLLIGALLMVYAIYYCKKHGEDKEKIAAEIDQLHAKGFIGVFKESFFAILSPVIILGCIYTGVASPTEAAVISVFYSLVVSLFIYKSMKFKDIWGIMVEGVRTYAPILFILAASIAFSRVLTLMRVPQSISAWILSNFHNKVVILLVIKCILTNRRNGHGYNTSDPYFNTDLITNCHSNRYESNSFWCYDGCKPCHRFRYTTDWSQLICGIILNGYPGDEDCTKSNAFNRLFPCSITSDHIYSADQSGIFIRRFRIS